MLAAAMIALALRRHTALFAFVILAGCPSDPAPVTPPPAGEELTWQLAGIELPSALLSVSARSASDVFAVGADKGKGPLVVHYDGAAWQELPTGFRGDLWWVQAFAGGPVLAAGQGAQVLRYEGGKWDRVPTPGFARQTIYGLWGTSATNLYAVGGAAGRDGFVWHFDGTTFENVELPLSIPRTAKGEIPGLFKVWGQGEDLWVVGGAGTILHRHAKEPFTVMPSGTQETLFTVHGVGDRVFFVGGSAQGVLLQSTSGANPLVMTPAASPLLQGVFAAATKNALPTTFAVGERGQVYVSKGEAFDEVKTGFEPQLTGLSLHATTTSPDGDTWAVGGNVLTPALDRGAILHYGPKSKPVAKIPSPPSADGGTDAQPPAQCPPLDLAAGKDKSVARRWDEQILASIRRDLPRPPVHARNLYHLSAAMWDAWAAYDGTAKGVYVREKQTAADVEQARREAISYAALRVLEQRYKPAVGGAISLACYAAVMKDLGYDAADARDVGDDARALGNRIGKAVVAQTLNDGANETGNYADPRPDANPNLKFPLVVDEPGVPAGTDPNLWQPLNLAVAATQNGIILTAGVQTYIGSIAGETRPFAMTRADASVPWHDAGPTPHYPSLPMNDWVVEVIRRSSELDVKDDTVIDVSPAALGNNALGTNDGKGYTENPITHAAYAPVKVRRADFGRVLAEFWADGPKSETPPGHWNVIANLVADAPGFGRKIQGAGDSLDPLAWDVHVYLALNGAVHDAAITAWDVKRRTIAARPLTLIRAMGQKGQSTDPGAPAYHPEGLPLVPGLIEVVTQESCAKGQRHEHLAPFVGRVVVRSWLGEPGDRTKQDAGVGWIRAADWLPYQRRNFVTPAFPGFISGHSTFSRSAAEVLAGLTGSQYFPGGYLKLEVPADVFLSFERGPSVPFALGWASYYDAADQAGQSRIWGGIHIQPDDFVGRQLGSVVGKDALRVAGTYFDGTAL